MPKEWQRECSRCGIVYTVDNKGMPAKLPLDDLCIFHPKRTFKKRRGAFIVNYLFMSMNVLSREVGQRLLRWKSWLRCGFEITRLCPRSYLPRVLREFEVKKWRWWGSHSVRGRDKGSGKLSACVEVVNGMARNVSLSFFLKFYCSRIGAEITKLGFW